MGGEGDVLDRQPESVARSGLDQRNDLEGLE